MNVAFVHLTAVPTKLRSTSDFIDPFDIDKHSAVLVQRTVIQKSPACGRVAPKLSYENLVSGWLEIVLK